MRIDLAGLHIRIETDDGKAKNCLEEIFRGWSEHHSAKDSRQCSEGATLNGGHDAELKIRIRVSDQISPLSSTEPFFIETINSGEKQSGTVAAYRSGDDFLLLFRECAILRFSLPDNFASTESLLEIELLSSAIRASLLEDILFNGLAPVLRRHGYYMVHGFAASKGGRALLLVGQSGSGKTTAGLSLVQQGWGYLANDMVILKKIDNNVWAFPTPGGISVTSNTAELMAALDSDMRLIVDSSMRRKKYFSAIELIPYWSSAVPVGAIYFPTVSGGPSSHVSNAHKATALAQVMECSIDRWDEAMLEEHVAFLEDLCDQARCSALQLGGDVGTLSATLSSTGSSTW